MANIIAAVSRRDRRILGQRTREGLAEARAKGVKLGGPIRLDPDVAERIRAQRQAGATLRTIADTLNQDAVPWPTEANAGTPARSSRCWIAWGVQRDRATLLRCLTG